MSTEQTQQAELTALAPQRILSIRGTIPVAQLGNAMGDRLGGLAAALKAQGLQASGPVFARYHSFDPAGDTDVEHGVPVAGTAVSAGQVSAGELPSGDAVSVWHTGDHTTLGRLTAKWVRRCRNPGAYPPGRRGRNTTGSTSTASTLTRPRGERTMRRRGASASSSR